MATIWILDVDTESGDHYRGVHSWDHEPTKEEQHRVLLDQFLDCEVFEGEEAPYQFELDGKQYGSTAYPEVNTIETPT
jgi:hypothetical protein